MSRWAYTKGLHEVASGHFAYLQPHGGWGYSNAGFVVDGDQSLLVDTLFDERLTAEMLGAILHAADVRPEDIGTLVNTHANGDHTFGNGLVPNAEVVASTASAAEMPEQAPEIITQFMKAAPAMGETGQYLLDNFGQFAFDEINTRSPTKTFDGRLQLHVGDKQVELIQVGPAHTDGDVLVHVPDDRVIYTGDILFIDGTPIMWAGPVDRWIAACDYIMGLELDVIVPGHGPVTDKRGVQAVRDYFVFIDREARLRYDAGMDIEQAALDIDLGAFRDWRDAERLRT